MKRFILPNHNLVAEAFFSFIFLFFYTSVCQAQSSSGAPGQGPTEDYAITQIGAHSRVWGNSAGQTVTEISTGMNFWNGQQWTPSNPSFVVTPDGTAFVANQIQDPTQIAANLNCVGAVNVTTPDNVKLSSTPIAIGLYDTASGLSAIVATLTNTIGVLTDLQDVVYDRAFVGGGFAASVVYSLPDTGSFHQDVVFVGFDPGFNPTNWGFAAASTNTLQIQIFTEFYDAPQPQMLMRPIYVEQNQAVRASMASPDIIDYTLDFGDYVFGPGRAYTSATNGTPSAGVTVAKDFVTSDGRTFLVESIPFRWLAGGLQALPPVVTRTSSLKHPPGAKKTRVAATSMPSLRDIKPGAIEKIKPTKAGVLASAKPRGVDVDYVVTVSSSTKPALYTSDTTYFVSGTVYDSASVTIESAVFKYPTNFTGTIVVENTLTLATTNYRPAVFTAADDNSAGTTLNTAIWPGYTGNPGTNHYGTGGLWLQTAVNIALNNLRFCYMNYAVQINADIVNQTVSLSHSELVDCICGINVSGGNGSGSGSGSGTDSLTLNVDNCLMGNVRYPFQASTIVLAANACNCTIDSSSDLLQVDAYSTGSFGFTNSILSSVASKGALGSLSLVGGYNGFYNSPGVAFGGFQTSIGSNPYQTVGAGDYYLSDMALLTAGTTNVGSTLLAQLQIKTVIAPLILTNTFTTNTVLTPVAQRDTTGTALGWHYDPIDYLAACSVSNATMLLINGVALAYYDNLGIWLQDGSQLVSQGTPNYRNYLVYYGSVQEEPGVVTNALAQALPIASSPIGSSANPSIFLRLTTICAPTGETNLLNTGDFGKTGQVISGLTLRDCEVYGSGASWLMSESNNTPSVGLTNNVFYRVPFAITNNAIITSLNNLFYGTTNTNSFKVSIQHLTGTSPNTNENDVFDGVTASLDGLVGYNAYLHGGTNATITNNSIQTNITWLTGPLGTYYQAANGPLLTNGSTYASNLDLYYYTVTTAEAVEGTNIVSRGYHYVALGTNGLPLDTDTNGIPNYLENPSGSGVLNPGQPLWGFVITIDNPANGSIIY